MRSHFTAFARQVADAVGSSWAFVTAIACVALWGLTGPLFDFSDTWQLVINTGTTIITFVMVFLIQSTQNRDAKAVHLKLDELICAVENARIELVDVEESREEEIEQRQREFSSRRTQAEELRKRAVMGRAVMGCNE